MVPQGDHDNLGLDCDTVSMVVKIVFMAVVPYTKTGWALKQVHLILSNSLENSVNHVAKVLQVQKSTRNAAWEGSAHITHYQTTRSIPKSKAKTSKQVAPWSFPFTSAKHFPFVASQALPSHCCSAPSIRHAVAKEVIRGMWKPQHISFLREVPDAGGNEEAPRSCPDAPLGALTAPWQRGRCGETQHRAKTLPSSLSWQMLQQLMRKGKLPTLPWCVNYCILYIRV